MDVPLVMLGVFGGWVALVVASDVFGLMRVGQKRLTVLQTSFLIFAIAGTLGCGVLYAQERHPKPCASARAVR